MPKSIDVVMEASFAMSSALHLAAELDDLRMCAEHRGFVEEEEEYPDRMLVEHGDGILETAKRLVEELAGLGKMITAAQKRPSLRIVEEGSSGKN